MPKIKYELKRNISKIFWVLISWLLFHVGSPKSLFHCITLLKVTVKFCSYIERNNTDEKKSANRRWTGFYFLKTVKLFQFAESGSAVATVYAFIKRKKGAINKKGICHSSRFGGASLICFICCLILIPAKLFAVVTVMQV